MLALALSAALMINCDDGVAVVDKEEYTVDAHEVIEWRAPFPFELDFDSPGNKHLKSHPKGDHHERKLGAASLRKGRNTYAISSDECEGDPVIIVR
jgi:hypothetical protein